MKGKITVLLGLVLVLAGLIWYAATLTESNQAANYVQKLVPQLRKTIVDVPVLETVPEESHAQQEVMEETIISGIGYVGVLEIPALSLELPVISNWSSENGKIAPCRYSGTVYQDDLILCAHNYDSHFGRLNQLEMGDEVEFTDIGGNSYYYQVREAQILNGTDVDKILEGDWDLTLFTCTSGGKMRYSIRCEKSS